MEHQQYGPFLGVGATGTAQKLRVDAFITLYAPFAIAKTNYDATHSPAAKQQLESTLKVIEPEARHWVKYITEYARDFPGEPMNSIATAVLGHPLQVNPKTPGFPSADAPAFTVQWDNTLATLLILKVTGKLNGSDKVSRLFIFRIYNPTTGEKIAEIHVEEGKKTNHVNLGLYPGCRVVIEGYYMSSRGERSLNHSTREINVPGTFDPDAHTHDRDDAK